MPEAQEDGSLNICENPECQNPASRRCPTCVKLGIKPSFFCSQDCFKQCWATHKSVHKVQEEITSLFNPWPNYKFTGTLRPATLSKPRTVPKSIPRPDYALDPDGVSYEEKRAKRSSEVKVLNDEEIDSLKLACKLGREVLDEAAKACVPGVTTDDIDRVVHEACIERECYPSPLGYYNFPKSVCTSVNEVICHGIPDMRPLEDGDICNVDVTVYHRGFHGDLNETFLVGTKVDEKSRKLVQVTYECLQEAMKLIRPGTKFRDLGNAIQKHANAHGFSVVRSYCGHGIHRLFHTTPNVPHYAKNKAYGVMKAGNSFTVEPMINAGTFSDVTWPDKWTAVTADGERSAQFEHTFLVTESGCEVLTERNTGRPWFFDQLERDYN